ncbi:MAG: DNA gyrase subunit A [bacterium]
MAIGRDNLLSVELSEEMRSSYLDYAMSVITARALPDVRDGLKPSNRRILIAMNDLNLAPNRAHRKCAKICGDTSGNYHPHGEQVVYPTLVRMAQNFAMRYPLVDGQGNFGSIDGDAAAAMRYTEARLANPAMELLADLDRDTVDFIPNYDETRQEPIVLPAKFPNLLVNGSSGIAVGMATNIPPHNLNEVIDCLNLLIADPEIDTEELLAAIQGPDFPTGGIIYGRRGIADAFRTGRGKLLLRAKVSVEKLKNGKENIIVSEIPFQVDKSKLLTSIADLVRGKQIEDISDLRDESDRDGMRIVIELRRDAQAQVVLNQLFKHTQMQVTFGVILLALVGGIPKVLTFRQMLEEFIKHRHEIVVRRTKFDLAKAEARAHILEGLRIALDHIDAIIKLIRGSKTVPEAKEGLMTRFKLSELQAQAILEMRLQKLTGLERQKIEDEYLELIKKIEYLNSVLESRDMRMAIIKEELTELKEKYGDERRTMIVDEEEEFSLEDLIAEEDMVITISHQGYIKRLSTSAYRRQLRGGKGVIGVQMKEEDFVEHLFVASTHDYILLFTTLGKLFWIKVHEVPVGGRMAKGKPIVNMVSLAEGERVCAFVPIRSFDEGWFLVMATRNGVLKKTELPHFGNPRRDGIRAINLPDDDILIEADITDGTNDIILATRKGQAIRFAEDRVRAMGRTAYGVKGINLARDDYVIGMVVAKRPTSLLSVTEHGYGKRSLISDYRLTNRGGKGVINIKTTERNGEVVAVKEVVEQDGLMLITHQGMVIRSDVKDVKVIGRATQGVRLINLNEDDVVTDVARIVNEEDSNGNGNGQEAQSEE